jgi:hypothetical protein
MLCPHDTSARCSEKRTLSLGKSIDFVPLVLCYLRTVQVVDANAHIPLFQFQVQSFEIATFVPFRLARGTVQRFQHGRDDTPRK